jgi:AAA family ATP:ADP antiporter
VSLIGNATSLVAPLIGILFVTRVAENTLDYSLSNTIRQSLWLVTPRAAKYKAKQVIDSFMWRAGDTASALIVWIGIHLGLGTRGFLAINVVVEALWVIVAIFVGRAYLARIAAAPPAPVTRGTTSPKVADIAAAISS